MPAEQLCNVWLCCLWYVGEFLDSQSPCRVITPVFTCQELSCCLPGMWCPGSCAQRAILCTENEGMEEELWSPVACGGLYCELEGFYGCKTVKAIAAFNFVGLPSKKCARKLINNNNTVKKHNIFCVPPQPLLAILGCRVLDIQWGGMNRKKEKVFQCCFTSQNHTALCTLGKEQ